MSYYSVLKRNELSFLSNEKARRTLTKWKKRVWKSYILYDSSYVTFWERQNYGDNKKISGCQGWRYGVVMTRQGAEDSKSVKTLCVIMMGACHYKFVQTCGMFNTKSESLWPVMDSGLFWCVSACPSLVTSMSFWWVMLVMGQATRVWGGDTRAALCLPLSFVVNLKLNTLSRKKKKVQTESWKHFFFFNWSIVDLQ